MRFRIPFEPEIAFLAAFWLIGVIVVFNLIWDQIQ